MKRCVILSLLATVVCLSAAMAQVPSPSSCRDAAASPAVKEGEANLVRDPSVLETRFKLAEALIAQECYEDAVRVLEEGEPLHPQNGMLEARLRSARSMISEQRYIESVTRAEEGARLQRNLLRCRKLADIAACDEALVTRRNDWELLVSKGDALVQKGRSGDALPVYRRAAEIHPLDALLQGKIRSLEAQRSARAVASPSTAPPIAPQMTPSPAGSARIAAVVKEKPVIYSNDAPAGRSN